MSRQSSQYNAVAEYAKDAHLFMKWQEEKRFRSHYSGPQLEHREELLVKMIYVATKYEENDDKASKLPEILLQFMDERPRKGIFIRMEFMILKFMQWKFIPTAVHFADYYVQYAVSADDLNHMFSSAEELLHSLRQYMKMFLRISLLDQRLMNEPRSLIASACIGAARDKMTLFPIWPNQMVQISGYRPYEICAYVQLLLVNNQKLKSGLDLAKDSSFDLAKAISTPCFCCSCICCPAPCINAQPASSSYAPVAAPHAVPSFPLTFAARDKSHVSGFMNDQAGRLNMQ